MASKLLQRWLMQLDWSKRIVVIVFTSISLAVVIAPLVYTCLGGIPGRALILTALITSAIIAPPIAYVLVILEKTSELNRIDAEKAKITAERRNLILRALLESGDAMHHAEKLEVLLEIVLLHLQKVLPESSLLILLREGGDGDLRVIRHMAASYITEEEKSFVLDNCQLFLRPEPKLLLRERHNFALLADWKSFRILGRDEDVLGCLLIKGAAIENEDEETIQLFMNQLGAAVENKLLIGELARLANHDQLTGLYNRNYFEAELARQKHIRHTSVKEDFSVILVDLNGLKTVNDTCGHMAGDAIIVAASVILKEACRKGDHVTRLGGDEFAIICPRTDQAQAAIIRDRILARASEAAISYQINEAELVELPVRLSVGLASSSEMDVEAVLRIADERMYEAKRAYYRQLTC
ncbi:MAG: diguanylate cyclase [Moraxellaceae bacterium]|jgi:diguanylate cyclase (GGDEF)-like protein|nr:diguanylate cyclase [Moraxellaceae bacterium]